MNFKCLARNKGLMVSP